MADKGSHLRIHVIFLGNDLNGLLVGPDSTITAHAPEQALVRALWQGVHLRPGGQGGEGHVICMRNSTQTSIHTETRASHVDWP